MAESVTEIGTLPFDRFPPLVGTVFQVRNAEGEGAEFTLVEASDLSDQMQLPEGHRSTPYSLLFRPDADIMWPQGPMTFEHEQLGTVAAFCAAVMDSTRPGLPAYEITVA